VIFALKKGKFTVLRTKLDHWDCQMINAWICKTRLWIEKSRHGPNHLLFCTDMRQMTLGRDDADLAVWNCAMQVFGHD
jgi:hypothetical protein